MSELISHKEEEDGDDDDDDDDGSVGIWMEVTAVRRAISCVSN